MLEFYEIDLEIHKNIPIKKPTFIDIDIGEYIFRTEKKSKIKKVTFNDIIYIHLIPYYNEIIKSNDDIWWNDNDFLNASHDASEKIKNLLNIHPFMTYKQAKKILYSPICYDKNNFDAKNL